MPLKLKSRVFFQGKPFNGHFMGYFNSIDLAINQSTSCPPPHLNYFISLAVYYKKIFILLKSTAQRYLALRATTCSQEGEHPPILSFRPSKTFHTILIHNLQRHGIEEKSSPGLIFLSPKFVARILLSAQSKELVKNGQGQIIRSIKRAERKK